MIEWKNLFRGALMGITDLIPGVSSGTLALLLGIYTRLLKSISELFSREWKRHIGFLAPLGISMVAAIFILSGVMEWLLDMHPIPTYFFFLGLVIGIIPALLRQIDYRKSFQAKHYVILLIAAALVALTVFFRDPDAGKIMTDLTFGHYVWLFFCGWLASTAMVLPGISGSFILLLLGVYPTVINAVSNLNIALILIIGCGVIVGIFITSRIITFLMEHYPIMTYAVIIGMVVGSIVVIFPGFDTNLSILLISAMTLIVGFIGSLFLSSFESKH